MTDRSANLSALARRLGWPNATFGALVDGDVFQLSPSSSTCRKEKGMAVRLDRGYAFGVSDDTAVLWHGKKRVFFRDTDAAPFGVEISDDYEAWQAAREYFCTECASFYWGSFREIDLCPCPQCENVHIYSVDGTAFAMAKARLDARYKAEGRKVTLFLPRIPEWLRGNYPCHCEEQAGFYAGEGI